MLLSVDIAEKSFGNKQLFKDLRLSINANEKVAIIGRNGVGKSTLFHMLSGQDETFQGQIVFRGGTRTVTTAQEHHDLGDISAVDYVLSKLPDYARLKEIIDTYPDTMGDDMQKITAYSEALERFSDLDYYQVEDHIVRTLADYQLSKDAAYGPLQRLSGGQKRFVELTRVEHSHADLALIDEPTNHMDYVAKESFIDWLKQVKHTVVVITHDRDVLQWVDRIIEVKDGHAQSHKGNYEAYLKQNAARTAGSMHEYEVGLRTLEGLHKQIQAVRAKKASTSKTPNPFIPLERRLMKEYEQLEARLEKPSFWIDRESASQLGKTVGDHYQKYKDKNIHIRQPEVREGQRELLALEELQLGYDDNPLFMPVSLRLQHGDKYRLIGRNGVGKTTLVRAIMAAAEGRAIQTHRGGHINVNSHLRLSVYEQEVGEALMPLTLADAIERIYREHGLRPTGELVMQTMSDYLFDPIDDGRLLVGDLSGGQKARLQIIKMLANGPNLLILDEPTNHLDLPSIEELEGVLQEYKGALLYVSHDSYFANNIAAEEITLVAATKS